MSKALKASMETLFYVHLWIEFAKNQINTGIICRGIVQNEKTNIASNLILSKDLKKKSSYILSSVFTIKTSKSNQASFMLAIRVNIVSHNCHNSITIW
jgi:hypothetical protein